jgi:hypothetical protein
MITAVFVPVSMRTQNDSMDLASSGDSHSVEDDAAMFLFACCNSIVLHLLSSNFSSLLKRSLKSIVFALASLTLEEGIPFSAMKICKDERGMVLESIDESVGKDIQDNSFSQLDKTISDK